VQSRPVLPEPPRFRRLYLEHTPGMMFRLGVGYKDRAINYPLHHPQFEVDESAILTGVVTLAHTTYKYWQQSDRGDRGWGKWGDQTWGTDTVFQKKDAAFAELLIPNDQHLTTNDSAMASPTRLQGTELVDCARATPSRN